MGLEVGRIYKVVGTDWNERWILKLVIAGIRGCSGLVLASELDQLLYGK